VVVTLTPERLFIRQKLMRKNNQQFVIAVLILTIIIVYLFVTAPPPLENEKKSGIQLPIEFVLRLANEENKVIRKLYTIEIVQAGKKSGIKFQEEWQEESVIAGMLPAQFLRETAMYLEKSPVLLGLYLGSEYPINRENLIEGIQATKFEKLKETERDVFFNLPDDETFVFMSPDVAIAKACVTCHNKHANTPKSDWKINDVMGATTWLYPEKTISVSDALILLSELRNGFSFSYQYFLNEVKQMPKSYSVGDKWPKDGNFVPSNDAFMKEFSSRASHLTLNKLLADLANKK